MEQAARISPYGNGNGSNRYKETFKDKVVLGDKAPHVYAKNYAQTPDLIQYKKATDLIVSGKTDAEISKELRIVISQIPVIRGLYREYLKQYHETIKDKTTAYNLAAIIR